MSLQPVTSALCTMLLILATTSSAIAQPIQEDGRSSGASGTSVPVMVFAAVGDYGAPGRDPERVARLVASWNPEFVLSLGDNNYPTGEQSAIDSNIGRLYQAFIHPYKGRYGRGAAVNKFFPCLGNHDWDCRNCSSSPKPYLDYFVLPGNERFYEFVKGHVHFFVLDSDPREPEGISVQSRQARWLQAVMARSTSVFKIVYFHHPPYASLAQEKVMRWPFRLWGAHAVLNGHSHLYERYEVDGIPYIVNGLGGVGIPPWPLPHPANLKMQYNKKHGAMRVRVNGTSSMTFEFFSFDGKLVDTVTARK
jgi:hypothetical protein